MIIDALGFLFKLLFNAGKFIAFIIIGIGKLIVNIFGMIYNGFILLFFTKQKRKDIKLFTWIKILPQQQSN